MFVSHKHKFDQLNCKKNSLTELVMNNLFDQIKIMKSNKHYRLGDLILCRGLRWQHDRQIISSNKEYENSFLKDYLESRIKNSGIDSQALIECAQKHSKNLNLKDDTLYINIRLGDSVMEPFGKINDQAAYGRVNQLFIFHPEKLMYEISEILAQHSELNHIQFVTALHFGDNEQNNTWRFSQEAVDENRRKMEMYFDFIEKKFKLPLSVIPPKENKIKHIDNQFLTLCAAKHVILDGAHFGQLIREVRKLIRQTPEFGCKFL